MANLSLGKHPFKYDPGTRRPGDTHKGAKEECS